MIINVGRILWEKGKGRLSIFFAAVLMMLVMTGCSAGSTIDATLMINKDLSGTRQINIAISEDVFDQYFNGSIEELNALIGENCPQGMTWSYSEEGGVKQYNMEIAFTSLQDYREKISSILGEEPSQLEIAAPDSVWASGIRVEESFSNKDLLEWMKNLLVDNGYVSSTNADMIFADGTYMMVYNDQTYNTGSKININQIEYVTIDNIRIMTKVNDLDHYDREVTIQIPRASMDKKGEEITAYLEGLVPAGASGEWSEGESDAALFTIAEGNMDTFWMTDFNKELFGSQDCTVTSLDVSEYSSPFTFDRSLSEHIDFSGFWADDSSTFSITYAFQPGDFSVYDTADQTTPGSVGWESVDGYIVLSENQYRGEPINFFALIQKAYFVQELTIKTARKFSGDWERISSFTLAAMPDEEEQDAIVEALKARGEIEVTEDEDISENIYTVTITQTGSPEAISESSKLLFGRADTILYARDRAFWKVNKQEAFTENISFGDLLDNVTKDFSIDYTAEIGMLANMQYCSDDSAEMKNGELHIVYTGNQVDVVYVGSKIDVAAILFWILVAFGVLNILILLEKAGVFKRMRKAIPVSGTVRKQAAEFCEKCGTQRKEGAKFCEKCGYKFDE